MGRFMKFRADALFTGYEMLAGTDRVLILNEDGRVEGIVPNDTAGEEVLQLSGTLCPGFINAHCHLELSHLKNRIAEGIGMADFIAEVMKSRTAPEDVKLQAMKDTEAEMIQNGIVAVGDICNTPDSVPVKLQSGLSFYNFIEATGFVPATANTRFNQAVDLYTQFREHNDNCSISPHAPYSVSPELFELIFSLQQTVVTMHNQESKAEGDFYRLKSGSLLRIYEQLGIDLSFFSATGKNSLQSVAHHFKNTDSLVLVHNCFTGREDLALLRGMNTHFCLCPNANSYIGNPLPDIDLLLNSGMNICLGTDSLASNHQLSIWSELQTIQRQFPHTGIETLLQWATLNGARALNMDDEKGSFEQGKTPGVVLIDDQQQIQRLV